MAVGVASVVAAAIGVHELMVLAGAGAAMVAARQAGPGSRKRYASSELFLGPEILGAPTKLWVLTRPAPALGVILWANTAAAPFGLWSLFLVFVKIGAVLLGSGYVLLAFLRADLASTSAG